MQTQRKPQPGTALVAAAAGALALGAAAIGALAIGALAIGRLSLRQGRIDKLSIGELTVDKLIVRERREPNQAPISPPISTTTFPDAPASTSA